MLSSRFFYHEGPKVLLADGVTLNSEHQIPVFLRSILAEDGTRCRYLGSARFSFAYPSLRTLILNRSEDLLSVLPDSTQFGGSSQHLTRC
ncbi:hypothetical protein BD310DRAFT_919393 [Dichomitus squalens]|uniref:Uncharacterized protein n=1 Tax=Dichomitus squalens TaxID=114155 RepID=A0A4Q9Q3W0_9APHY|nr:hypothetical protein BD310DRAFT_919393 [Dichomitus squalens]